MAGIVLLCFCNVLLGAVPVLGGTEYRLGGIDGNSWQAILAGESAYQAFAADGQVERQVSVVAVYPRLQSPQQQWLLVLGQFSTFDQANAGR